MIFPLQYMRAIAAMMVVYAHISVQLLQATGIKFPFGEASAAGVDIFFVISGFIMWQTTCNSSVTLKEYFYKRLTRIVPLYWCVTIFVVSVMLCYPGLLSSSKLNIEHVIASFFFIPYQHPVFHGHYWPVVIPGWTLNYEMAFYVLLGLALPLSLVMRFYLVIGVFVFLVALGEIFPVSGILEFYTNPILLEFAVGICLSMYFTQGIKPSWSIIAFAIICGLALLALSGPDAKSGMDRLVSWGCPAALLVFGVLGADRQLRGVSLPFGRLLGDASYSIYLTHVLVLPAVTKLWKYGNVGFEGVMLPVFVITSLLVALSAGVGVHLIVEKPLLGRLRHKEPLPLSIQSII